MYIRSIFSSDSFSRSIGNLYRADFFLSSKDENIRRVLQTFSNFLIYFLCFMYWSSSSSSCSLVTGFLPVFFQLLRRGACLNLATELVVSEQVNELSRSELEEGGTTFTSSTELPMHTLFQQSAAASASASDLNSNGFFSRLNLLRSKILTCHN